MARAALTIDERTSAVEHLKEEKKSLEVAGWRKEQETQAVARERLLQKKKNLDLGFERERNLELNLKSYLIFVHFFTQTNL